MEDCQILELLKESEGDSEWVSKEYDKLRAKYAGKVFAVRNKNVLSDADTTEELVAKLKTMGEDVERILIETIPQKGLCFIL